MTPYLCKYRFSGCCTKTLKVVHSVGIDCAELDGKKCLTEVEDCTLNDYLALFRGNCDNLTLNALGITGDYDDKVVGFYMHFVCHFVVLLSELS